MRTRFSRQDTSCSSPIARCTGEWKNAALPGGSDEKTGGDAVNDVLKACAEYGKEEVQAERAQEVRGAIRSE